MVSALFTEAELSSLFGDIYLSFVQSSTTQDQKSKFTTRGYELIYACQFLSNSINSYCSHEVFPSWATFQRTLRKSKPFSNQIWDAVIRNLRTQGCQPFTEDEVVFSDIETLKAFKERVDDLRFAIDMQLQIIRSNVSCVDFKRQYNPLIPDAELLKRFGLSFESNDPLREPVHIRLRYQERCTELLNELGSALKHFGCRFSDAHDAKRENKSESKKPLPSGREMAEYYLKLKMHYSVLYRSLKALELNLKSNSDPKKLEDLCDLNCLRKSMEIAKFIADSPEVSAFRNALANANDLTMNWVNGNRRIEEDGKFNRLFNPFVFICAPSGTGKMNFAFSLGLPSLYFLFDPNTSLDQEIYKCFKKQSLELRRLVEYDLEQHAFDERKRPLNVLSGISLFTVENVVDSSLSFLSVGFLVAMIKKVVKD